MTKAGELVMRLFHARTTAHVLHLKSRSYAQHVALNEFYDGVVPPLIPSLRSIKASTA